MEGKEGMRPSFLLSTANLNAVKRYKQGQTEQFALKKFNVPYGLFFLSLAQILLCPGEGKNVRISVRIFIVLTEVLTSDVSDSSKFLESSEHDDSANI